MPNIVSIIKSSYDDLSVNLSKAIELAGGIDLLNKDRILIKLNLCDARPPDTGAISHPLFLDALLDYIRNNFGNIPVDVIESDGRVVLADEYVKWFGFEPIIKKWGANFVNLSRVECEERQINGYKLKSLSIPKLFSKNAFLITLPKLKTNSLSTITCCIKNQRGCNPMLDKQIFHDFLDDAIVDENLAVGIPDFCIVDGILGMGGTQGPAFGVPIWSNLIICGKDEVAVDTVCSRIMGFNPHRIGHIKKAARKGLGSMNYVTKGESISNIKQNYHGDVLESLVMKVGSFLQKRNR